MRLSIGEVLIGSATIFCLFLFNSEEHWTTFTHTMTVAHSMDSKMSDTNPTYVDDTQMLGTTEVVDQLRHIFEVEQINLTGWNVVWRGKIKSENVDQWLQEWENESSALDFIANHPNTNGHDGDQEVWKKEKDGKIHQIQLLHYPHKHHSETKIIYTWSGFDIDPTWKDHWLQMEKMFQSIMEEPEFFITLNGVTTGAFLRHNNQYNTFDQWILNWRGQSLDVVKDHNFFSITGYIPVWEQYIPVSGDNRLNIQMSARQNMLKDETFVTLGYPLILQEH